jgi:hypothetical protein
LLAPFFACIFYSHLKNDQNKCQESERKMAAGVGCFKTAVSGADIKTKGEEKSISLCLGRDTSAEKDLGENHAQQ